MEVVIVAIPSLIAAVGGIASAYITSKAKAEQEKTAKDAKEYREQREKLDKAKNGVLIATMEGVTVLLQQAKGEKMNGNVEEALGNIHDAKHDLRDVRNELVAKY
ncbi:MAG: hypothetical protein IJ113_06910 [Eggerthellaceae bacterium]|nr:hypothetical protein [Eggerthellaceae bacterium]MBQ9147812.1 hypothetical protein [Rikenellaceae bacterium]